MALSAQTSSILILTVCVALSSIALLIIIYLFYLLWKRLKPLPFPQHPNNLENHGLQTGENDLEAPVEGRNPYEGLKRNCRADLNIRAERERVWRLARENDRRPVS